jgi:hypothetical protein
VPAVNQARHARNVFHEDPRRVTFACDAEEFVEHSHAVTRRRRAAEVAEVLAWRAGDDPIDVTGLAVEVLDAVARD